MENNWKEKLVARIKQYETENHLQSQIIILGDTEKGIMYDNSISDKDRLDKLLEFLGGIALLRLEKATNNHSCPLKEICQKLFSENIPPHDSCEEHKTEKEIVYSFDWGENLTCLYQLEPEDLISIEIYNYRNKKDPDLKQFKDVNEGILYLENIFLSTK